MADPAVFEPSYVAGHLIRPTVAEQQLLNNPRAFLRRYPLNLADDGTVGASGPTNRAYMTNWNGGQRPGSILRTLRMHNTEGFCITMTAIGNPVGHQLSIRRVATVQSNQPADWCPLPTVGGAALMTTCMLTGCSFIVRQGVNEVECGHLLPTDLATNTAIETGVALNNRLLGQGYLAVYGRNSYSHGGQDDRRAAIVGVRRNAAWKIYVQKRDFGNNILSVHRIYPPE
jgi:hypothetical protein